MGSRAARLCIAIAVVGLLACAPAVDRSDEPVVDIGAAVDPLPLRTGPAEQTTGAVPHVQLDATPVPAIDDELRRRVFSLPGIEDRPSDRSTAGARGFAFDGSVALVNPAVIAGSSEFGHVHPDGSLHLWLPTDRATEVEETGWGELHPWVEREGFWDGVVMVFTPETADELDVVLQLVVESYNFLTAAALTPADLDPAG